MTDETQTEEIRRAHEWITPRRGERGVTRCRVCGVVKSNVPSWCYTEPAMEPSTEDG